MPRTVNVEARAVRREAFVDVALRLIQLKGYEQMSVQDVLDELDASRGAFYYYFDSKLALLEAAVDRVVEVALAAVAPVAADPTLRAVEKLGRLFTGIAGWKAERKELMLALIEVWCSDDNAIVREKLRRSTLLSLVPLLARIIEQGRAEGVMSADSSEGAGRAVVSLMLGAQDLALELFLARQANAIPFEVVETGIAAYTDALERILGVRPGSLALIDEPTLRLWFG
ncbi:MAG: TetR/AcrR family transcriptional regulator [Candidatus Dormibacteria bacterium]